MVVDYINIYIYIYKNYSSDIYNNKIYKHMVFIIYNKVYIHDIYKLEIYMVFNYLDMHSCKSILTKFLSDSSHSWPPASTEKSRSGHSSSLGSCSSSL